MNRPDIRQLMSTHHHDGRIEWLGVRPAKHAYVQELTELEVDTEQGIIGDHYQGRSGKRQVTILQHEHLAVIQSLLHLPVDPRLLRRNFLVSGINVHALRESLFRIGPEVILAGTGDCHPCSKMEQNLGHGGYSAMRGHGGITCRVVHGGKIKVGDSVTILSVLA